MHVQSVTITFSILDDFESLQQRFFVSDRAESLGYPMKIVGRATNQFGVVTFAC